MTKMRRLWFGIIVVLLVNGIILYCSACFEEERIALLHIKSKFKAYPDPFPSWMDDDKTSDCCKWEGVKCNNITMQVIELSVNGTWSSTYPYFNASMFLPFKKLMSLYLPENYLEGWFKNEGFDKLSQLRNLEVLDLSFNRFNRSVLSSISQLSSLKVLKLSSNLLDSSTNKPSSERLSGLNNLEVLDLGMTTTNQSDIVSILNLNDFISLKYLDISSNGLHTFGSSKYGLNMAAGLRNLEFLCLGLNLFNNSIFSSLKELPSLKYLDLSDNKLKGTIFAQELDALSNLEELDLSRNEINDFQTLRGTKSTSHIRVLELNSMKSNISNLLPSLQVFPELKSLYFENNDLTGTIFTPTAPGNLSNLEEIFLDHTSLNGNFLQGIGLVTSLKVLSMSYCGLNGTLSQIDWRGLENLQELTLRGNQFHGSLPSCLANLTSVRLIDISSNRFTGNIAFSSLSKLTSLESLFISKNSFEVPISFEAFANHSSLVRIKADANVGVQETESRAWVPKFQLEEFTVSKCTGFQMLPRFLYYQKELRSIDLSKNQFRGRLPNWLLENNTKLEQFLMGGNDFIGSFNMPSHTQPNIKSIEVLQNRLSGKLHMNISSVFPNIEILKVNENYLEGEIPCATWGMKHLRALNLSNNQFSGELPTELAIPPSLVELHLSGNKLIGKIPKTLFSIKLVVLEINQNSFSGMIPPWMGQMSGLAILAMSQNQLQGPIPMELCNLSILQFLDLSENQFSGSFPSCFNHLESLEHLFLNTNLLNGNLTHAFLDENSALLTLDLSNNHFSGRIPQWIDNLSALNILLLKNNQFEGEIPNHLCHLQRLRMTDLSHNKLTGSIPRCLGSISNVPTPGEWRDPPGHQVQMKVEFTTKNSSRNYEGSILRYMSGIDLSSNQLSGEIPIELGNLSVIQVLNLSHNSLMGGIPKTLSNLHAIGCIDLSYNNLSGSIPDELLELHSLATFNVAHNNLSGAVPDLKDQFSTFDENSYEGNPFLCGPPLHINCSRTQLEHPFWSNNENEEGGFIDMEIFYISFSVACPIFFLGVIITLCVNHYWRDRWFRFVEYLVFSCYYFLVDRFSTTSRM